MSSELVIHFDILNSPISFVDGRPYMVFYNTDRNRNQTYTEECDIEQEDDEDICIEQDDHDLFPKLKVTGGNETGYVTLFHVSKAFIGFVLGKQKCKRKQIEYELKCRISMHEYDRTENLEIRSDHKSAVIRACFRIHMLVMEIRARQDFTHFLSFPATSSQSVIENYHKFVSKVTDACGVPSQIFQSSKKLHLTIGTLVLSDKVERENAMDMMDQIKTEIINPLLKRNPIKMRMRGLEYMNDDPTAVNVLYGKVISTDNKNTLQKVADAVFKRFDKTGLMKESYDKVKLHVTLMNTRFLPAEPSSSGRGPGYQENKSNTFDATPILKMFGDYNFGEFVINDLHISQRYSVDENGYYKAMYAVQFS